MQIENPRRGGVLGVIIRALFVVLIWAPLPAGVYVAQELLSLAGAVPEVPNLDLLQPKFGSRVETVDGWQLAGAPTSTGVPYHELPPLLIASFLAAEDEDFFVHSAFSSRAILRAALQNYRAGKTVQGASTITQQVAKQFLSSEKTYKRKVEELLLARRLEAIYSKQQILDTYLRSVFLGHRAEGVTAASWRYFAKDPRDLELHEMATIAGILPAPSTLNPITDPDAAKKQKDRVIRRMLELGMISQAEHDAAADAEIQVAEWNDFNRDRMPGPVYGAIRTIKDLYGDEAWGQKGLIAIWPQNPVATARARTSLRQALLDLDQRQGWRGAPATVVDAQKFDELTSAQNGRYRVGRVVEAERNELTVAIGAETQKLALKDNAWLEPNTTKRHYKRPEYLKDFRSVFKGDEVVFVDTDAQGIVQKPAYEGAFLTVDSTSGRPIASAGAFDVRSSEFDRAFMGCRQPGSVFKPVVYSEALSRGISAATMLSDVPTQLESSRGEIWTPRNADRNFKGYITLANALAWSRNIPTVNLLRHLGAHSIVKRARKMGVVSVLDPTDSMSLGSSCIQPWEVARIYMAFQRSGRRGDVHPHAYFKTTDGRVEHDALQFQDGGLSMAARLDRFATIQPLPDRATTQGVAFVMKDLLRRVVTSGTAHDLPKEWLVAGKTGTTNTYDGWFVGFDDHTTTVVWTGSDKNDHALGKGEHGATSAMPAFQAYYAPYARVAEDGNVTWPENPPEDVEYVPIDPTTGLRAPPNEYGVPYAFVKGSAPMEFSPTRGTKQAQKVDELLYEF